MESLRVFLLLWKGSSLSFSPTAFLYYFRTREELDRYLEASQIRERAIERITNVIGTYDASAKLGFWFHVPLLIYILSLVPKFCWVHNLGFTKCRYNDLRLRIFSKYPQLFPEEVFISYCSTAILYMKLGPCILMARWFHYKHVGKVTSFHLKWPSSSYNSYG